MHKNATASLILASQFIEATRDSGYKSLGSALAELIDNAFEAKATEVTLTIVRGESGEATVVVSDDGRGMDADTCRNSLRFGWSSRFNQRDGHGRYGMGLPNASLSHARCVDVLSSTDGRRAAKAHLDADEFREGRRETIEESRSISAPEFRETHPFQRGTTVVWRKCDRLENRKFGPLTKRLRAELGRLFRYQLWAGKRIKVNGDAVLPVDPLFEKSGCGLTGANAFGPESTYEVAIPGACSSSVVRVRFSELPVGEWHSLSNTEKNATGIAKGAGVSVVRAGREIDFGWFFMGGKRRENYDDWWRCEVRFEPDLDELFGVTHTKQEIHPTEKLAAILSPDMEKIARELNTRARKAFIAVKATESRRESEKVAERYDNLIEPPSKVPGTVRKAPQSIRRGGRGRVGGLEYRLRLKRLHDVVFFKPELDGGRLTVVLNEQHPFVRNACGPLSETNGAGTEAAQRNLEVLILAAARTEVMLANNRKAKKWTKEFRRSWSNVLATFLS
jgi:hypothetical protein